MVAVSRSLEFWLFCSTDDGLVVESIMENNKSPRHVNEIDIIVCRVAL